MRKSAPSLGDNFSTQNTISQVITIKLPKYMQIHRVVFKICYSYQDFYLLLNSIWYTLSLQIPPPDVLLHGEAQVNTLIQKQHFTNNVNNEQMGVQG